MPTERGLASTKVDGQDPPINNKGIQSREKLVSDQERGDIIITIIICSWHINRIETPKGNALFNGRNVG